MAHSLSAKKRIRQNEKRNARNRWRKATMRDALKDLGDKLLHAPLKEAEEAFKKVSQVIDRTAAKGAIHKNQAARRKSRLSARLVARKMAGVIDAPPRKR
ncbi:30S ribosomal protein S20 [soil metagenome]